MTKHEFGGPWTLIKLDLLGRYLSFFNTALLNKPSSTYSFTRIYIDAFAGTGSCDINFKNGSRVTVKGSAKIAIDTEPPFQHIHLIDLKRTHVKELRELDAHATTTKVSIYQNDANIALQEIISGTNWRKTRGVLFLDPYGMAVEWRTLQLIANTQALDVWYLFPLSAVYRQAARAFDRIDDGKAAVLDKVLGTHDWREKFYEIPKQDSLLNNHEPALVRTAAPKEIAAYVHQRLNSLFKGWVSDPIFLPENGAPMFVLFFACSNPSPLAVKLSRRPTKHLLKMLGEKKIGATNDYSVIQPDGSQTDMFSGMNPSSKWD